MAAILFSGPLLDYDEIESPTQVRGFDAAGNPLFTVRTGSPYPGAVYERYLGYQDRWHFSGLLEDGSASEPCYVASGVVLSTQEGVFFSKFGPLDFYAGRAAMRPSDGLIFVTAVPEIACVESNPEIEQSIQHEWIRVFSPHGRRIAFPDLHGARIHDVDFNPDGSVIVGGHCHYSDGANLRKYSASGSLAWSAQPGVAGDIIRRVKVAPSGDIYTSGFTLVGRGGAAYTEQGFCARHSASGTLIWRIDAGSSGKCWGFVVDESAGVVFTSMVTQTGGVWSNVQRRQISTGSVLQIAPGGDTISAAIGLVGSQLHVVKLVQYLSEAPNRRILSAADLSLITEDQIGHWIAPINGYGMDDLAFDSTGVSYNGYRQGDAHDGSGAPFQAKYHYHAITTAGVDGWTGKTARPAHGVFTCDTIDPSTLETYQSGSLIPPSFNTGENLTYSQREYVTPLNATVGPDYGATSVGAGGWSTARVSICTASPTAALDLSILSALPLFDGDAHASVPAIRLGLSARVPSVLREYVGTLRLPDVYRITLGSLSLRASSISIRRDASGDTLTAVITGVSADDAAAIANATGQVLTCWRGVRFKDGAEQLDTLLSVTLDSARWDAGASSGSVTVSGSTAVPSSSTRSRTVAGVSYRASSSGQRRARCSIDTYLAPGDTAVLPGGEAIVVAEITITIQPGSGVMEIAE